MKDCFFHQRKPVPESPACIEEIDAHNCPGDLTQTHVESYLTLANLYYFSSRVNTAKELHVLLNTPFLFYGIAMSLVIKRIEKSHCNDKCLSSTRRKDGA